MKEILSNHGPVGKHAHLNQEQKMLSTLLMIQKELLDMLPITLTRTKLFCLSEDPKIFKIGSQTLILNKQLTRKFQVLKFIRDSTMHTQLSQGKSLVLSKAN